MTVTARCGGPAHGPAPDPVANLATATEAVRRAADAGAELVAAARGDPRPRSAPICGRSPSRSTAPFATGLRKIAAETGVVVIAGLFEPAEPTAGSTTPCWRQVPAVDASYRKIHLYDAFGSRESDLVAPGKELVTFDVRGIRVGLATCYDLDSRTSSPH